MRDDPPADRPSTVEFRKRMGMFATGVCVITVEPEERPVAAMTINSFVSVSLEPMLVCWSLHNASSQFDLFRSQERFAISILADHQAPLALRYAARADTLLEQEDFVRSAAGLPVVAGSLGHFDCRQWAAHEAGDHTLILGEVFGMSEEPAKGEFPQPLGFFNGKFCSIDQ